MMIAIMCNPATWHPADGESQRVCGHTMNDKGVHHLSRDRQTTLCGKDCAQWVFVVKTKAEGFVGDQGICPTCMEKL